MRVATINHYSEPRDYAPRDYAPRDYAPLGLISKVIVIGLMAVMVGATLAFGSVEPWSLATLGLLIAALLLLWGINGVINRRLKIVLPSTALPILALLSLAVLQSATYSIDAEATRLAAEVMLVLLAAFLLSTNFLAAPRVLSRLRNFLIFFGLALAVFGLIQHFTWNGKFFWVVELRSQPPSPFGPFVNHNNFAGFVEMIAPIPLVLILRRAVRGGLAFIYGFAAAMMGLAVIMSLSRGGMISLVSSLMFVIAIGFKPRSRKRGMGSRRQRDGATEGLGDWATGRPGDEETEGQRDGEKMPLSVAPSFRRSVAPSPRRPVAQSFRLSVARSLRFPIPLAASRVCAMVVMLFTISA